MMPSPFSSPGSIDDSVALARACGIETMTLPIDTIMRAFDETLRGPFAGRPSDVTEENIQARIRGNLLMALSNKTGALLLTTGNKSELAVGYCTLYGDMSGGLAVIADVPKTMVYRVSRWLNERAGSMVIPEAILTKAPSAELRPDQTDQDVAAAVRCARRHSRAAHRGSPVTRRHRCGRIRPLGGRPGAAARANGGVQAQASRARAQGDRPRLRHRMAHAHRARRVGSPLLTTPQHRTSSRRPHTVPSPRLPE